MFCSLLDHLR